MGANSDNRPEQEATEEGGDRTIDFWSDEGAEHFNEMLDEGSDYTSAVAKLSGDFEMYLGDEQCEYFDPELFDPDGETLPPGEMELIFENSYVM